MDDMQGQSDAMHEVKSLLEEKEGYVPNSDPPPENGDDIVIDIPPEPKPDSAGGPASNPQYPALVKGPDPPQAPRMPRPKVAHKRTLEYMSVTIEEEDVEVNKFQQFVLAHFLAFGYTSKALSSALGNILKWKHVGKLDLTVEEGATIIYRVYGDRRYRLPFHIKMKSYFLDLMYDWHENRTLRVLVQVLAILCIIGTILLLCLYPTQISIFALLVFEVVAVWYFKIRESKSIIVKNIPHIQTYCTRMKLTQYSDLSVNHVIDYNSHVDLPELSTARCKCKLLPVGFSFGLPYVWIPQNCIHNELNALVTRQLQKRLPVTILGEEALDKGLSYLKKFFVFTNTDEPRSNWLQKFLEKYPAARRDQILKSMEKGNIVDVQVKGFPKIEVMTGKPCAKRKVRFISGFSDGYLAETGPEYYLWQKAIIKQYWGNKVTRFQKRFVYTGGMLADEIGEWFTRYCQMGWVFLLIDYGKFDSRNKHAIINRLHNFYINHMSKELYEWLEQTFNKKGKTSHGIQFDVEATVASGRIDTSMGNTLIIFMLVVAKLFILDPKYLEQFFVSALGDDNNTALPEFNHTMDDVKKAASHMGHEADGMIVREKDYHLIEYCSQRLWWVQVNRGILGPKPFRLLAKTFVCHKTVPAARMVEHISGVLLGFRHYRWLPVFRAVYQRWFQVHKGRAKCFYNDTNPYKIQLKEDVEVDETSVYFQFERIYGFDPTVLEAEIMKLDFSIGDTFTHPLIEQGLRIDGVAYDYELEDYTHYMTMVSGTAETLNW